MNRRDEESLINQYRPLLFKLASRLRSPRNTPLSRMDLVDAGMVGLIEAIRSYDPLYGVKLETHVYNKVIHAMIDEIRLWKPVPVWVSNKIKEMKKITGRHFAETGQNPSDELLAAEMGVSRKSLFKLRRAENFCLKMRFGKIDRDQPGWELGFASPDRTREKLSEEKKDLLQRAIEAMNQLKERDRQAFEMYFLEGLSMTQIAERLGVTASRISQILHRAAWDTARRCGIKRDVDFDFRNIRTA